MRGDQGQGIDGEANESGSYASDSPSRKRLLADPTPSQDSTASSDSSDRTRKKTRDLPNLSDCHGCGVRINNTNPEERLETLGSVWRVVLLCKKCIKRVKLAEVCSYCFSKTAGTDCFRCRDCERRVHKDCVVKYRCSVPWSYCPAELEFSVCVDCWVPKSLANANAVGAKLRNKKIGPVADSGNLSLEDVVNDANCAAKKKVAVAAKAKENALRKAVLAKTAVELANGALDLMVSKDESSVKNESTAKVMDDTELAFHLHRAINSSPRISRNSCLLNSSYLVLPNILESNGNGTARLSGLGGSPNTNVCEKFAGCITTKLVENLEGTNSESLVFHGASNENFSSSETDGLIVAKTCVGLIGKSNSDDNSAKNSESLSCQKPDELVHKLQPNKLYSRRRYKWKRKEMLLYSRKKKEPRDRYLIKYTKRHVNAKVLCNNEGKFLSSSAGVESRTVASGVSADSSKESRLFSNAPSQSCDVAVQDSPCGARSPQDKSLLNQMII